MFDRQGITEGLVRGDSVRLQFEDAVTPLISYSLVRLNLKQRYLICIDSYSYRSENS
jgi:hypothetical protein